MDWFVIVLKKYAEFTGRARRKEYWMFTLISTIISAILSRVDLYVFNLDGYGIDTIYSLAILIPTIAVSVRRMHDVGRSGWYILIPIYNLIMFCTNGDVGENKYGPDPKNPNTELDEIGVAQS